MKTLKDLKSYQFKCIDGRDLNRLVAFLPFDMLKDFGFELKEGSSEEDWNKDVLEFNRENVLSQLRKDVEFGWEKAINERGISSNMMSECVKLWNYVLQEGLEDLTDYGWYGRNIFKATADKYGWELNN